MDTLISRIRTDTLDRYGRTRTDDRISDTIDALIEAAKAGHDTSGLSETLLEYIVEAENEGFEIGLSTGVRVMTEAAAIYSSVEHAEEERRRSTGNA